MLFEAFPGKSKNYLESKSEPIATKIIGERNNDDADMVGFLCCLFDFLLCGHCLSEDIAVCMLSINLSESLLLQPAPCT